MELLKRTDSRLFTQDRYGTGSVYGEKVEVFSGNSYREWIPWRSKMGALLKRRGDLSWFEGDVLYLGAAQGTTVSHLSDIMENNTLYAVEFSPVAFRKLASLSKKRDNIVPILADAFHPERYSAVLRDVDILYQDVSQKDQVGMFMKNAERFLRNGGKGFLMLKARSIDVTSDPSRIYDRAVSELKSRGMEIETVEDLSPFQVDHSAIITRYSG